MERLISSSLLSSRTTPLRPRLLLPPRTSSSRISCRIGFPLLPSGGGAKSGDVFFSDGTRLAALLPSSPSSRGGLVRCSDEAARAPDSADAFGEQSIGRTRFDSFRDKAASRGGLIMLAATILFLIRPMLVPAAAYSTMQSVVKAGGTLAKTELLSSAWAGFFTGCLHTLSGPDHLAALAPLSIGRTRMESAAVGALWGCGHDAGQVLFGLLFLVLKDRLHIEVLRTWGTRVVAVTLLVIGAMGIREAAEIPVPAPCAIVDNGNLEPATGKKKKEIGFATFATGIIHGLQPDALMMVLPALALPSRLAGAAFLGMFLVGTVVAMGSYTVFIGSCSEALKDRIPRITEKLTWASSLLAISMGLALIISQYFGFSLY